VPSSFVFSPSGRPLRGRIGCDEGRFLRTFYFSGPNRALSHVPPCGFTVTGRQNLGMGAVCSFALCLSYRFARTEKLSCCFLWCFLQPPSLSPALPLSGVCWSLFRAIRCLLLWSSALSPPSPRHFYFSFFSSLPLGDVVRVTRIAQYGNRILR